MVDALQPSVSPEILLEQTGLRITKNPRNGFTVVRLHFTADPRKRSAEWMAASKQGLSAAKWEQEFNISYNAQQGEKAFPEIVARRSEIVSREGPYIDGQWPVDLPMWGGFDYGARNASAFTVYTLVDGVIWAIWEMYGACKNLNDYAEAMKSCPYWTQIRYIVHDPDISNLKSHNANGDTVSIRSQFESRGITKWVSGNNDEAAWLATMAKHWCGAEVTFRIVESCPMLIDEFEQATFITMSDRQLETQNYRESLVDRHNHAMDACKYFMNSGIARERGRALRLPSLVAGYGWTKAGSQRTSRYGELGI